MTGGRASGARHLRRLVVARSLADHEGVSPEAVDADAIARSGPREPDLTGRLEAALSANLDQTPEDETGDPREYRRAKEVLLRETQQAAVRLDADPGAPPTPREERTFEAVVRTDGTRPSLLVRNDVVDPAHPTAGDWKASLSATQEALRPAMRAVGRIEPAGATARDYFGTGWVVDADGRVLTNLHVVEAMWQRMSHVMEPVEHGFRVYDGVFIDFAVEAGSARTNRYRVVEAVLPDFDGPGNQRLDAAVLRIEPTPNGAAEPPPAIPVAADPDGPQGHLASFCVVGYPAAPRFMGGIHEGVDWTWVTMTLFGNRYGVKRLAPGTAHVPLASVADDPREWVFGHDATTLGGSSGSPVLDWFAGTPQGFGLHFAGASVQANMAHAVVACADELVALGVPVP